MQRSNNWISVIKLQNLRLDYFIKETFIKNASLQQFNESSLVFPQCSTCFGALIGKGNAYIPIQAFMIMHSDRIIES